MSDDTSVDNHPLHQAAEDRRTPAQKRSARRADAKVRRFAKVAARQADAMPAVGPMDGPREVREVEAPLVSPAPTGGLREVFSKRYLLRLIVRRELAQMYSASVLGLIWSYVQPAVRFGMYFFIMGVVLEAHRTVPFFAIHLFCGMVFVHYFTETFNGGTRSIVQNRALVKKMAMPREMFPVASSVVALYHTVPQMILLALICVINGWHITMGGLVAAVLGFSIILVFGTALALIFSACNVFFRDFQNIVATLTYFVHFMVPMMYAYSRVRDVLGNYGGVWLQLYLANPIAVATMLVQRFFWYGVAAGKPVSGTAHDIALNRQALDFPPHLLWRGVATLAVCLVLLAIAQRIFSRLENKFPERL